MNSRKFLSKLALIISAISYSVFSGAQESSKLEEALQKAQKQPWAIEVYYEIKDGHEQEFLELYKKNHWPVLNAEIEEGSLISVDIDSQQLTPPGAHQWDFRVTMVFTNILYRYELLERPKEAIISRLYPDRERFEQEERRRLELIAYGYILDRTRISTADWPTQNLQESPD